MAINKLLGDVGLRELWSLIKGKESVINARMDTFTHLDDGSTTGDAELADIRVGADGVTYNSAGAAVRGQVSDLSGYLDDVAGISTTWSTGFWDVYNNTFNSDSLYKHSDYIAINEITVPIHYTVKVINTVASYILFDENKNYIGKHNTTSTSLVEEEDVVSDFQGASFIVFETNVNHGYSASLRYCNINDLSVVGYMKNGTEIPQSQLSFAEFVPPENLFDYTSSDMCKPGYWYYSTSVGSTVSATQSNYTKDYVAIKVPVLNSTKITLGMYPDVSARMIYWVGAADTNMKLISYSTVNQNAPVTYNLPEGAVYFLASYYLDRTNFDTYLPKVMAVNADSITSYSPYSAPYYLLNYCKTDDYSETEAIQTIVGNAENEVKLKMPDNYDIVVGDTFQLFYKGIISSVHYEMFDIVIQCSSGMAFTRYFEVTPTTAGTLTMNIKLYGINHNLVDEKNVTLTVHAKASSPSTEKNVLCVGDSLTAGGVWPAELNRRLTGTGGTPAGDTLTNIAFVGTRSFSDTNYEAYGGWTWNGFNTENVTSTSKLITCTHDKTAAQDQHSIYTASNGSTWKLETIESGSIKIILMSGSSATFPSTGTLTWASGGTNHSDIVYTASENAPGNPFWDSTEQKVDFGSYATRQGISSIDYVYALVGWNCVDQPKATIKSQAQTFIDNVQDSFPNAQIVLMGIEIPARDGLALNYGATGAYSKYYDMMNYVFDLDDLYEELASENTNVSHLSISGQFDTEYNMLTDTRPVNTRNSETTTYQTNGVHPAISGSHQIADAVYRDITKRI